MTPLASLRDRSRQLSAAEKLATAALGASTAVVGATALELKRRLKQGNLNLVPNADLVRGVAARMTTPLLPDDYLHMLNPLWTAREVRARSSRSSRRLTMPPLS